MKAWLKSHDMNTGLDTTDDSFRARQKDPGSFDSKSFRTITLTGGGESIKMPRIREKIGFRTTFCIEARASTIEERNVPWKGSFLAAVPGTSLNRRTYPKEVLQRSAQLYDGKPFILDHDVEHSERVVGILARPRYARERGGDGLMHEGLWLDGVGLMDEDLFEKLKGDPEHGIPPLIRGVSIGGEGEGDWQADGSVLIKSFNPAELSLTAFPGIPAAQVAGIEMIAESLNRKYEVKKSSIPVKERSISLEEAEKQVARAAPSAHAYISEGPLPGPDSATSTRSLRGAQWAKNDSRAGIPAPTVRTNVVHTTPQATTSSDSGILGNGSGSPGEIAMPDVGTGSYAKAGYTTTTTPGFGKLSKSGTGLPEQEAAPGTAADAGAQGSKDAKAFKPKTPKTGHTTTRTPGYGKLSPSGSGIDDQDEEVESVGSKDDDNPHPRKMDRTMTKNPMMAKPGENPHDKNEGEEENVGANPTRDSDSTDNEPDADDEEEEEEETQRIRQHGPSPHIPGKPVGRTSPHSADNAYDSPADSPEEEEEEERFPIKQDDEPVGVTKAMKPGTGDEEEDGVSVNPVAGADKGEEERYAWSDANPDGIKAAAYSLPADSNISKAMLRAAGILNPNAERDEAQNRAIKNNVEFWNKIRNPPAAKPKKIIIKRQGPDPYARSEIATIKPTRSPVTEMIRTKTVTSLSPTIPAAQITTKVNTLEVQPELEQLVKQFNGPRKAYLAAFQNIIGFQYDR